ncbi:TIR domain-containing protein [Lentzea alba]|uniref:TIR domain-containing protein n=1 Tax=Lentzea alba TaxID=2714351 RepID=UPI0039BF0F85
MLTDDRTPLTLVFISYSREERPYVRRLAAHLREVAGVDVWFDYELDTGDRWDRVVCRKIDECAALILVMTPEAESSHWVGEELARARSRGKRVLPLLLKGSPIFGFQNVQYEDVRGGAMPGDRFVADLREKAGLRPRPPAAPVATKRQPVREVIAIVVVVMVFGVLGVVWWPKLVGGGGSADQQTTVASTTGSTTSPPRTTSSTSVAPVRGDVRCYNNSTIAGLATVVCDDADALGWNVVETGNFSQGKIPTSAVYYRGGTNEEAEARELGDLLRLQVAPRFDAITGAAPGLIVIVTNDYQGPKPAG